MGSQVGSKSRFISEINITPFVDVMLVLLIIFMVAAPMLQEGLEVNLPNTKEVQTLPSDVKTLVVTIRKDGSIYLDTTKVARKDLLAQLNAIVKHKDRPVYIQADKAIAFENVVQVMGELRAAGITNIGIVALDPKSQK